MQVHTDSVKCENKITGAVPDCPRRENQQNISAVRPVILPMASGRCDAGDSTEDRANPKFHVLAFCTGAIATTGTFLTFFKNLSTALLPERGRFPIRPPVMIRSASFTCHRLVRSRTTNPKQINRKIRDNSSREGRRQHWAAIGFRQPVLKRSFNTDEGDHGAERSLDLISGVAFNLPGSSPEDPQSRFFTSHAMTNSHLLAPSQSASAVRSEQVRLEEHRQGRVLSVLSRK